MAEQLVAEEVEDGGGWNCGCIEKETGCREKRERCREEKGRKKKEEEEPPSRPRLVLAR